MRIAVEFPSVSFREGPEKVADMARAIEEIGYDELAVFDHVIMGYPTETRRAPMYPPQMPILEALVMLAFAAAVTKRVSLSTEVLVLPQRQPILVAKQISTLDTLSGGRVRLGVGVGWQRAEYDVLNEDFGVRGKLMDDAIRLLRACWADEKIDFTSDRYNVEAIAMEPKPPQGGGLPIWVGGGSKAALRRTGELGDGWMGTAGVSDDELVEAMAAIRRHAEAAGRDPSSIGMQLMLAPPPRDEAGKTFYSNHDQVVARAVKIRDMGCEWTAVNATAIFQAGARSVDAMIDELNTLHGKLRAAVG
ncbi:MAG: LLM class F420-dependent oxidoreductase [Acidimicrobiia bacterium]|nr:LLM class F420-dependent oxidoreductase [Acidimicrobiia bacterium]